jgi:hypothetical protein
VSKPPKKPTAIEKLRNSQLRQTGVELMGDDIDLDDLYLALNHKDIDIINATTSVEVLRTIQGAGTVTVTVEDRDRVLLRSGRLSQRNDIEIDGLFFRLVAVGKDGSTLTLTFEDREISILRRYDKPIKQSLATSRVQMTRAQFVKRLVLEPKEFRHTIPIYIPELDKVQPLSDKANLPSGQERRNSPAFGIPKTNDLFIKTSPMSEEQRKNANAVLDTGTSLVLKRPILVMAIMCCIQESTMYNLLPATDPNTAFQADSVGLFQQRKSQGWPATRDIPTDATEFYKRIAKRRQAYPNEEYTDSIQAVQISGSPKAYAQWRNQAERIVTSYGVVDATYQANSQWQDTVAGSGDYEFYRGKPPSSRTSSWGKENSWDCIQRLAGEVGWRAYFVAGRFFFLADDSLLQSEPIATIDEDSEGVISIDGDYDEGKKTASLNVACRANLWAAPPGSVIQIQNMGPWNGRFLVNDIRRTIGDPTATITLKKKQPRLPEPAGSNLAQNQQSGTWTGTPPPSDTSQQFKVPGNLVQPVPKGYNPSIVQGIHSTAGLSGESYGYFPGVWPSRDAADFGGDAGAPVLAVENGTIAYLSGHNPALGPSDPIMGVHGPFGWSVYLKADSGSTYYYTHLGTRKALAKGMTVRAGQVIGTIGDYAKWGGVNHTHVGVNPGPKGHPDISDLMAAQIASAPTGPAT